MSAESTLEVLESLSNQDTKKPFGPYQEEAVVSLAFDYPEFFISAARFMKPDMFNRLTTKWIIAQILNNVEEFSTIPTRKWLREQVEAQLTEDQAYEEIYQLIDRKSDPREIPMIKDTILKWSRDRTYGLLYSSEAQEAYIRGDYEFLDQIINDANKIADVNNHGFWFFDDLELLFQPDIIQHRTTGFPKLDRLLNNGGPSPKEVLCWLAGTNVGKSLVLCNNAITSLKGEGPDGIGQNVLLVTFELDAIKTAMRCLASATSVPINDIVNHKDYVRNTIESIKKTYKRRLLIHEMAPDECSVNSIYALLSSLEHTENWRPDVLILDYMDLMISRNPHLNKDDYTRQKHVASEIRGLAKNKNILIFTATQTNRSGVVEDKSGKGKGAEPIDMSKAAESFAKQFSLDYVVSLNQGKSDRRMTPPRLRLFVAKNRNGPKHETISCEINYDTMTVKELL